MLDLTAFAPALKIKYPKRKVEEILYKNSPFLAMVPKNTSFFGSSQQMPLIYEDVQNTSSTFSVANGGVSTTQMEDFLLTRKKVYAFHTIDNETIEASSNDEGAFLNALSLGLRSALRSHAHAWSRKIYGGTGGTIGVAGTVATSGSTTTITLSNIYDVVNFAKGMVLKAATAISGGSLRAGSCTVTAIDRSTGILTCDGLITSFAAADYIVPLGDYDKSISGIEDWLPYTDRATRLAASFYGVTRTSDSTRLGGWTADYRGRPLEEALIDMSAILGREGGNPDYCFMNPIDYANLRKSLGSKVVYNDVRAGSEAHIGFRGIMVDGDGGPITVLSDRFAPRGYAHMLQLDTWQLCSLGDHTKIFEGDGLRFIRSDTSDGLDVRVYGYGNLGCYAPGYNFNARIA